jgi:hypothetical protein
MQRTDIIYALFRCFNGHVTLLISCDYVYRHKRLFYVLCLLSLMNSRQYNLYNNCFQSSVAEAEPGGAVPGTTRISRSVWTCLRVIFVRYRFQQWFEFIKEGPIANVGHKPYKRQLIIRTHLLLLIIDIRLPNNGYRSCFSVRRD